ncbi:MAG: hypothetical protein ACI9VR_001136 [Cognaticolwellia sp.]
MRYVTGMLDTLFQLIGVQLPSWGGTVFLLCVLALLGPFFYRNSRTKKARKRLQDLSLEGGQARLDGEAEVLELVRGHAFGLVVVVEEANKRGMRRLVDQALEELDRTGKHRDQFRRLSRELGEKPTTAAAEAIAIERLRETGLDGQAQVRLDKALSKFPGHPELLALIPGEE